MMKDFWNTLYTEDDYVYGKEPNIFLTTQLPSLSRGKLLFPAEGEGRNAVYAAQLGFDVTAFDLSESGKAKADALAQEKGVTLHYEVNSPEGLEYEKESFDGLVLLFAHFQAAIRKQYHHQFVSYLKVGGTIIFEAFGKDQIHLNSGGPKDLTMLFSEEEILAEFPSVAFHSLETLTIELDEGNYHQGKAVVVRFKGTKIAM